MAGWPHRQWGKLLNGHVRNNPWDVAETVVKVVESPRNGGGANEDRLRHRWKLLEISERTGESIEQVIERYGMKG